jgi:hypothetical protein
MFETYTEKARRAIFYARYEARQSGSHTAILAPNIYSLDCCARAAALQ